MVPRVMGSSPIRVPFFFSLSKNQSKYYFSYFAFLLILIAPLHHFLFAQKEFEFTFINSNYIVCFWRLYLIFALVSLMNAILYLLLFHFKKIKSERFYQLHFAVFLVCTLFFLIALFFQTCSNYYHSYYAYNEFYKLEVNNYFNNCLSVSIVVMIFAQLLLPINFVCSLLKKDNTTL